jgi:hypothetical protein
MCRATMPRTHVPCFLCRRHARLHAAASSRSVSVVGHGRSECRLHLGLEVVDVDAEELELVQAVASLACTGIGGLSSRFRVFVRMAIRFFF